MRKTIKKQSAGNRTESGQVWFNLERMAEVEITSEDADHPVEGALVSQAQQGWRAAHSGVQTIRLVFAEPCNIRRIHLEFEEKERNRTQEFVLRWSSDSDSGGTYREIVRQQYNFAPSATTLEIEDYQVELESVTALELQIRPDVAGGDAVASLKSLRLT